MPSRRSRLLSILTGAGLSVAFTVNTAVPVLAADVLTVGPGETYVVNATTHLDELTIAAGGQITAGDGQSVTLTVNGIETGSVLAGPDRAYTVIGAGTYSGDVVLSVTPANHVTIDPVTFQLRQALYVADGAVQPGMSVTAAITGGTVDDTTATDLQITSTGEAFNGVYVANGQYTLDSPDISLTGNGRSDFAGYGAAVVADGGSQVRIDDASISDSGVVRTPVVATGGSTLVVTDSTLACTDGVLPADYVPTVNLPYMQSIPWMLGATGNCRTTNLLGTQTKASYLNSTITSSGWGAMSTDTGSNMVLAVVNSRVDGGSGYGSYAIGNATEYFLGVELGAEVYAAINRGGTIHYGDASRQAVAAINDAHQLGLSDADLDAVTAAATTVNSERFGVMWHGGGAVVIDGATRFNTGEATFLDKGQAVNISVDGSQGAQLNPANGVLFQLMEDDDPGPVAPDLTNTGVYREPTDEITPAGYDIYTATSGTTTDSEGNTVPSGDAITNFTDISLTGDFYNGIRGNNPASMFGPGMAGLNLAVNLTRSDLTGVISSTVATHRVAEITAENYQELGTVTNRPSPAVNNGTIVGLTSSTWTVTGTSYLTSLSLDAASAIQAPAGSKVVMTVDGVQTAITPGSQWIGNIELTLVPADAPAATPDKPAVLPRTGTAR